MPLPSSVSDAVFFVCVAVVVLVCGLRKSWPITVTVKSRKSLQLDWTNVPNQLANIGCCLRAALLPDSRLLVGPQSSVCVFFYTGCGLLFSTSPSNIDACKQEKRKRERENEHKYLTGFNRESLFNQRRDDIVSYDATSFCLIAVLFSIWRICSFEVL